jgi:predicted HD phosphohydrolase
MDQGTDKDFQVLKHVHERTLRELPDRLLDHHAISGNDTAYNISRYDHCLQSATRALRDGKDEESSSRCYTTPASSSVLSTTAK